MKLSELVSNNAVVGLLKFSEKKYLESLSEGKLYMNQFKYFKELEEKDGRRGQGDEKELASSFKDVNFKLIKQGSKQVILEGSASELILRNLGDLQNHLYCATAITPNMLEVLSYDEETKIAQTKLCLSEKLIGQARDIFGDHVGLINAGKFLEKVDVAAKKSGVTITSDIVSYRNQCINSIEDIKNFHEATLKIYYEKDNFFEYQNEYRLVAFGGNISGALQLELGDIHEYVEIMKTEELFENDLTYTVPLRK